MGDDLALPERWPVRTCMQWTDDESGGFSSRLTARLLHHIVHDEEYAPARVNAVAQQRDPDSLFNWLRRLVEIRQSCPEIGWGDLSLPQSDHPTVLVQQFVWDGRSVLVLHNLSQAKCNVHVTDLLEGPKLIDVFGNRVYSSKAHVDAAIELDGYGYRWFRME
ncbi:hypothetical protein [Bradyrhizobium sp. PRIMUS42]|uniref:alpha-amylase family glycosyl hydrolase n=1 Tax=Bradyrhizobium sp. PRIMUS42 TaxID=2908926 RepID=UPI001FF5F701|nr:hypothetical protein [Bradyrhizobium sp. PRIMUS42]MCJ9728699.1 hypothetical protein [Bradyrhizobium sp. PRIMUS42]